HPPRRTRIERLRLSDKPEGKPFLYARSLSPERAILRVGRDEKIVAIVRNLGGAAKRSEAKLTVPKGIEVLSDATRKLSELDHNATERVEWVVKAKKPVEGHAEVAFTADGFASSRQDVALRFVPSPNLPKASYVPPPRPAKSPYLVLMHYCALWKLGTHYGWQKIEPWPDRRPAIGFYDEGTPEVADWHIKYALEHGVQGFIYCWYRADLKPTITHTLGHAIHDGLLKARYRDQFKFAIMWENGCAQGVKDRDDLMGNLLPYWMDNYFKHPSYVKIDNKPLLYIWVPSRVHAQLGGPEGTRKAFDDMRAACRKEGFDGLHIVGCVGNADKRLLEDMGKAGWDASSAYAVWPGPSAQADRDVEGISTHPHRDATLAQKDVLLGKKAVGALPDVVCVMMGWDPRPWHGAKTSSYQANPSPENFEAACRNAKQIVDSTPGNGLDKRVVALDNWCEFGEGHYLEPVAGFGFQFLDAARRVFCTDREPCVDITPEDVGLELPERVYKAYRAIVGPSGSLVKRKVVDDLIAWWAFDEQDENLALDSSACDFKGFKQHFESAPGVKGKAFRCKGGWVSLEAHELFFPLSGLTVELWFKTDLAGQSDKWMLNTVGRSDTGYRLGLTGGKLGWQIPQTPWSHMLSDPDPAP
ncbi:MAG: hypothetical protein FJ278_15845, partial [Planctomycetes bacterium]|nr:hypothetical protein [Planctomycetota bacterium]